MKTLKTAVMLKSSKSLKRGKPIAKRASPRKQKLPTITLLRRKADKDFGHYVRLRDSELMNDTRWVAECISCNKPYVVRYWDSEKGKWRWGNQEHAGHFVGRGNYFLRYFDENVNDQCARCNRWLHGNNAAYATNLDLKYGFGTAQRLINEAAQNKDYKITREALQAVIHDSKEQLNFYLKQERIA